MNNGILGTSSVEAESQLVAVYRCDLSGARIEININPLDDTPAEAIDCPLHQGIHSASLANIVTIPSKTGPERI